MVIMGLSVTNFLKDDVRNGMLEGCSSLTSRM